MRLLEGRSVIVTGAPRGIDRAFERTRSGTPCRGREARR